MGLRRDLRRGLLVTVHLTDGTTADGCVKRVTRKYLTLTQHRLEAGGVLHELASDRVLIPMRLLKAVEVKA